MKNKLKNSPRWQSVRVDKLLNNIKLKYITKIGGRQNEFKRND